MMRLSFKARKAGAQRRASDARTLPQNQARIATEQPQAKLDPRGAPEMQPCPEGSYPRAVPRGTHTQTGRGSAERRSRARPVWVTMEISRSAVASTTERSDSSAGACCFKNGKTSDPSRPRASTTKGVSSACGFCCGGYRFLLCSSRSLAACPGVRALHRCNLKIFAKNRF